MTRTKRGRSRKRNSGNSCQGPGNHGKPGSLNEANKISHSSKVSNQTSLMAEPIQTRSKRLDARSYRQAMSSRCRSVSYGSKGPVTNKASTSKTVNDKGCKNDVVEENQIPLNSDVSLTCADQNTESSIGESGKLTETKNVAIIEGQGTVSSGKQENNIDQIQDDVISQTNGDSAKEVNDEGTGIKEPNNLEEQNVVDNQPSGLRRSRRLKGKRSVAEDRMFKKDNVAPSTKPHDVNDILPTRVDEGCATSEPISGTKRKCTTLFKADDATKTEFSKANENECGTSSSQEETSAAAEEARHITIENNLKRCNNQLLDSETEEDQHMNSPRKRRKQKQSEMDFIVIIDEKKDELPSEPEVATSEVDLLKDDTDTKQDSIKWRQCSGCNNWQWVDSSNLSNMEWHCRDEACQLLNPISTVLQEENPLENGSKDLEVNNQVDMDLNRPVQDDPELLCPTNKYNSAISDHKLIEEEKSQQNGSEGLDAINQSDMDIDPAAGDELGVRSVSEESESRKERLNCLTDNKLIYNIKNDGDGFLSAKMQSKAVMEDEYLSSQKTDTNESIKEGYTFEKSVRKNLPQPEIVASDIEAMPEIIPIDNNACHVCQEIGELLCCDGKDCMRKYHIECLEPALSEIPPGQWYCPACTYKRVSSGAHSVSKGVESIWAVKVVSDSDSMILKHGSIHTDGFSDSVLQKGGKMYFVKFKGLSHIHNCWMTEEQINKEAPKLINQYIKKLGEGKVTAYNSDWAKPQRFILKRSSVSEKHANRNCSTSDDKLTPHVEWFVKWSDLSYRDCTWELESFLLEKIPSCRKLIEAYKKRHSEASERATRVKRQDGVDKCLKWALETLKASMDSFSVMNVVKILEFFIDGRHGVVIDEFNKGRVSLIASFIVYLVQEFGISKPILIVTTVSGIYSWETEISEKAPLTNSVSYNTKYDSREIIQKYEFVAEDKSVMPQIVFSTMDVITTDLEFLKGLEWGAVIIDECQPYKFSKTFSVLKQLPTAFRLVLFNEQMKVNTSELSHLLAFLGCSSKDFESHYTSQHDNCLTLGSLKKMSSDPIIYERKVDALSSEHLKEYWVPVELTNVQTDQYCDTLVRNRNILCWMSKKDDCGVLRDILLDLRKCCNHPYLVDASLQQSLRRGLAAAQFLEFDIKVSSKIQLLDYVLSELQRQQRRVLVLFQTIGRSNKVSVGDMLDDHIRQRFGVDSYERVDAFLSNSKKQAALRKFNNRDSGQFVFLLEKRACGSSIKLSVDTVIIFDSDWNPTSDLRALQKLQIDKDQIKVFRLYCKHTIEDSLLSLAKKDILLDNVLENISTNSCQCLLKCGVETLFENYDANQKEKVGPISSYLSDGENSKLLAKALSEFACEQNSNDNTVKKHGICRISWANDKSSQPQNESNKQEIDENAPAKNFWTKVLNGREVRNDEKEDLQRPRRKVHYYEGSPSSVSVDEDNEARRKRKRAAASETIDPISLSPWLEDAKQSLANNELNMQAKRSLEKSKPSQVNSNFIRLDHSSQKNKQCSGIENGKHDHSSPVVPREEVQILSSCDSFNEKSNSEKVNNRCSVPDQRLELNTVFEILAKAKPELGRLGRLLNLPDSIQTMAEGFLESVATTEFFSNGNTTMLHAGLIALCHIAAGLLKHDLNLKNSLELARMQLSFECQEEDINPLIFKLRKELIKSNLYIQHNMDLTREMTSTSNDCPAGKSQDDENTVRNDVAYSPRHNHRFVSRQASDETETAHGRHQLRNGRCGSDERDNELAKDVKQKSALEELVNEDILEHQSVSPVVETNNCPITSMPVTESAVGCSWVTLSSECVKLLKDKIQSLKQARLKKQQEEVGQIYKPFESKKNKIQNKHMLHRKSIEKSCPDLSSRERKLKEEDERFSIQFKILEERLKKVVEELKQRQSLEREKENQIYKTCLEQIKDGKVESKLFDHIMSCSIKEILSMESRNTFNLSIRTDSLDRAEPLISRSNPTQLPADVLLESVSVPTSEDRQEINMPIEAPEQLPPQSTDTPQSEREIPLYIVPPSSNIPSVNISPESETQSTSQLADLPPRESETLHDIPQESVDVSGGNEPQEYQGQQLSQASDLPQSEPEALHVVSRPQSLETLQLRTSTQLATASETVLRSREQLNQTSENQSSYQNHQVGLAQNLPSEHTHSALGGNFSPVTAQTDLNSSQRVNGTVHGSYFGTPVSISATNFPSIPPRSIHGNISDPLHFESLKIQKEKERNKKIHEDEMLQVKSQYEKELEEIKKKYTQTCKEKDLIFTQKDRMLDVKMRKIDMNRRLAEAFRIKTEYTSVASPFHSGSSNQFQPPRQQISQPSLGRLVNASNSLPSASSGLAADTGHCNGIFSASLHSAANNNDAWHPSVAHSSQRPITSVPLQISQPLSRAIQPLGYPGVPGESRVTAQNWSQQESNDVTHSAYQADANFLVNQRVQHSNPSFRVCQNPCSPSSPLNVYNTNHLYQRNTILNVSPNNQCINSATMASDIMDVPGASETVNVQLPNQGMISACPVNTIPPFQVVSHLQRTGNEMVPDSLVNSNMQQTMQNTMLENRNIDVPVSNTNMVTVPSSEGNTSSQDNAAHMSLVDSVLMNFNNIENSNSTAPSIIYLSDDD